MADRNFSVLAGDGGLVKVWMNGVPMDDKTIEQVSRAARLPFIHKHVAVMPDAHVGRGSTVGSVIPTVKAIIPAAVGVDIGCGMFAVQTDLTASRLGDNLSALRTSIEELVPHGRTDNGGPNDRGAWGDVPKEVFDIWDSMRINGRETLLQGWTSLVEKHPKATGRHPSTHLGTLGTGNHFIEICLDETDQVWAMLHSGSRGQGNKFGSYFISKAKQAMQRWHIDLEDPDLAYIPESEQLFDDYIDAVDWAQKFAAMNRGVMMSRVMLALHSKFGKFETVGLAVNCHHNYVERENHFGQNVWVTRKGAVRARQDDMGIIPGSMGARSYIVRGKGNPESFHSCSHGAGRVMSRTQAKKAFTVEDHIAATAGVECRKDEGVIDETPAAYKDIDAVMAAQDDLVEVVHTLRQVVCVKG